MQHFLEAFTVIDFWGIMVPGGFFVFFLNTFYPLGKVYWDIVGQYVEKPTEFGLAIFLLVVSYILGSLIHEFADYLGKILSFLGDWISDRKEGSFTVYFSLRKSAFKSLSESIQEKYSRKIVDQDFELDLQTKAAVFKQHTNDILTALYAAGKVGKLNLFDSFRIMSRNSAVVIAIWWCISCRGKVDVFGAEGMTFLPPHRWVAFALICAFAWRSSHYARLKYKYAYESYYQLKLEEKKKTDEKAAESQQDPAA